MNLLCIVYNNDDDDDKIFYGFHLFTARSNVSAAYAVPVSACLFIIHSVQLLALLLLLLLLLLGRTVVGRSGR